MPASVAASTARSGSSVSLIVAAVSRSNCRPRTDPASTKSRTVASHDSSRRTTPVVKARGAGSSGSHSRQAFREVSSTTIRRYRGLPSVCWWSCSAAPAGSKPPAIRLASSDTSPAFRGPTWSTPPLGPNAIRRRPSGIDGACRSRVVMTTNTRSVTNRRNANSSACRESLSAQWASSMTVTTTRSSCRSPHSCSRRVPTVIGSSAADELGAPSVLATLTSWSSSP